MKLNADCIREILIITESIEYNSEIGIDDLHKKMSSFSIEEVEYHAYHLWQGGYIVAIPMRQVGNSRDFIVSIRDLTFLGHQFLAEIRSDNIWNSTKNIAKDVGSDSLSMLKDIALQIAKNILKQKLGLP